MFQSGMSVLPEGGDINLFRQLWLVAKHVAKNWRHTRHKRGSLCKESRDKSILSCTAH